jgi:hypothetical protein
VSSIVRAIPPHHFFERDGALAACQKLRMALPGDGEVLEIAQVLAPGRP